MTGLSEVFRLAVLHVADNKAMESSARLCLADARRLEAEGNLDEARARALKSLRYSVGIFHADYRKANDHKH